MGRILVIFGIVIVLVGLVLILLERFGLPHLPGDILIERENYTIYIPIATSIIVSIILSLILYLGTRLFR